MAAVLIGSDWPRHPRVCAAFTTRSGGESLAPYDSFNLAHHVDDDPVAVEGNRRRLRDAFALKQEPAWLDQVHGTRVARISSPGLRQCADASWTDQQDLACAILSADCLPVLFADAEGRCVAAAHAGWRGLAAGVLESTLSSMPVPPEAITAWLGPAISLAAFEVGGEVRDAFLAQDETLGTAFSPGVGGRWFGDLYAIARARLSAAGVQRVHGGGRCTVSEAQDFFSYRRDGRCGRMATLVWLRG